jgi:hypothetical protein
VHLTWYPNLRFAFCKACISVQTQNRTEGATLLKLHHHCVYCCIVSSEKKGIRFCKHNFDDSYHQQDYEATTSFHDPCPNNLVQQTIVTS